MPGDAQAAAAEELILAAGLAGKTSGQIGRLAARIRFWREHAGSRYLPGFAANDSVYSWRG